ncbi:MAG: DivIVA domain-containing protein [Acidimicrobiales bacterium]
MDNSQSTSSTLDTLRTVEFRLGLKGYNVDEVDEYLDKAAQEAEALQEHVRQLNERLRQASERIGQLESEKRSEPAEVVAAAPEAESATDAALSDETLQRTLLLAQKFVDQTKRESEAEAAAIVAGAEEKARQLHAEGERQLREDVERLEASRAKLAADVESMARHLESERNRLRTALSEILKWVDENVQPANSLMGVRPKSSDKAPAAEGGDAPSPKSDGADDGAPTLNLQNAAGGGATGAARPL